MRIIISPAKKMNVETDGLPWRDLPAFLPRTEVLAKTLQGMGYDELKKLWKCNDSIATVNVERLAGMDLHTRLTPAVLAYEGIQYQYMAPSVFTDREYDYIQEHLRIFSETDCIINLASKEYSICVSKYLRPGIRFITCVFGEEKDGKIIEKGTMCKMARGEMVRYMAEHQIENPEQIRAFDRLEYAFDPQRSDENTYVFVKGEKSSCSLD